MKSVAPEEKGDMTHPRVMERPLQPAEVLGHIREWLNNSLSVIVEPGRRHLDILGSILDHIGAAGNLTTAAVIAAIAMEYQAEVHFDDAAFFRFPGLHWYNPLQTK